MVSVPKFSAPFTPFNPLSPNPHYLQKKKNPDFFITLETPQQKSFHYTLNPKTKTITKQSKTKTKQHKKTNQ